MGKSNEKVPVRTVNGIAVRGHAPDRDRMKILAQRAMIAGTIPVAKPAEADVPDMRERGSPVMGYRDIQNGEVWPTLKIIAEYFGTSKTHIGVSLTNGYRMCGRRIERFRLREDLDALATAAIAEGLNKYINEAGEKVAEFMAILVGKLGKWDGKNG